ncbi:MAG: hypothetical protein JXA79_07380, partial [Deltaproteobacteria bacterium]|nr:hypothetical protein [Deltaproteobacteria bacterium]
MNKQKALMKWLVCFGLASVLFLGLYWYIALSNTPPQIKSIILSNVKGEVKDSFDCRSTNESTIKAPLVYGKTAALEVILDDKEEGPSQLGAFLESDNGLIKVVSSQSFIRDNNTIINLKFIPNKLGKDLKITLHYSDGFHFPTYPLHINVEMPAFFNEEGFNYLEMIKAPDESIYGSHITIWQRPDRWLVSGHAASNVCRVASSALFTFALYEGDFSADFFLGAGLGSISMKKSQQDIISYLEALSPCPKTQDLLKRVVIRYYLGEKGVALHQLCELLSALKTKIKPTEKDVEINNFLQEIENADSLSVPELNFLFSIMENPNQTLDSIVQAKLAEFTPYLDEIKLLDSSAYGKVIEAVEKIALHIKNCNLIDGNLSEVATQSGLLDFQLNHLDTNSEKNIRERVKEWLGTDPTVPAVRLSALAEKSGLLLLPYYLKSGEELSFTIPRQSFAGAKGDDIEKLLSQLITTEMLNNVLLTAANWRKHYEKTFEYLKVLHREARLFSDFRTWLKVIRKIPTSLVDERGEQTGVTDSEELTNLQLFQDRINWALKCLNYANMYNELAVNLKKRRDDPNLKNIIHWCLIDSFLRKWRLAFVDESMSAPYQNWIDECRDKIWTQIFDQAGKRRISPLPLISENTVFMVKDEDNAYRITPLFVAHTERTTVIRDPGSHWLYYDSDWNKRRISHLSGRQVGEKSWNEAIEKRGMDNSLRFLSQSFLDLSLSNLKGSSERIISDERLSQSGNLITDALLVAPNYAASKLMEELWNRWEGAEINEAQIREAEEIDNIIVNWISRNLLEGQSHINFSMTISGINEMINKGSWPFADDYLLYVLNYKEWIESPNPDIPITRHKEYRKNLIANGSNIDKDYMEEGLRQKEVFGASPKFIRYKIWKSLGVFKDVMKVCMNLSKISQKLNNKDTNALEIGMDLKDELVNLKGVHEKGAEIAIVIPTNHLEGLIPKKEKFDQLDRYLLKGDLADCISKIALPAIAEIRNLYDRYPRKQLLDCLVQLQWYSG